MERDRSSRRRYLRRSVGVASAVSLAGCLTGGFGSDGNGGGGTDATGDVGTPTKTEAGSASSSVSGDSPTQPSGTVSFEAPHGATIEATAYGRGDCGVVFVPQINMDRESWRPRAEMIANMGHRALAIDEDPDNRSASVRGAIRHLHGQEGVSTLVLVGASTGGEAVVVANAETNATVDGTVTLSAAGGVDYASDLQGRSLFVVSKGDENRFVQVARELHRRAPEPTNLIEYGGSAHGQGLFTSKHGDNLVDRVRTVVADVCEN